MALRDVDDLGAKTRSTEQRQWDSGTGLVSGAGELSGS